MKHAIITIETASRARITGEFPVTAVRRALSFPHPRAHFSPRFRSGLWDGRTHLLTPSGAFPAGLVALAKRAIEKKAKKGYTVEVVDHTRPPRRKRVPLKQVRLNGIPDLFEHQKRAVKAALKHHRGIIKMATGGGKTETMCATYRALGSPPTLVIVPNRNLLKQTIARFEERLGEPVGMIGFGQWSPANLTVAIPNTLTQAKYKKPRKKFLAETEALFLDEAHHSPSTTWMGAIKRCLAYYRLAFSGTPLDRADGATMRLIGETGPLLIDISSASLVKTGHLAKPTVQMVEIHKPDLSGLRTWSEVYNLGVVRNRYFHTKVIKLAKKHVARGKQVLVLVTRIEHGQHLSNLLEEEGLSSASDFAWLHGSTPSQRIEEALADFKKGDLPLIIASPIFGEGADIPSIDVLIIADGGKAVIGTVQKAGRAIRVKKGKPNEALIIDFAHFTNDYLVKHSLARLKTYRREQFPIKEAKK